MALIVSVPEESGWSGPPSLDRQVAEIIKYTGNQLSIPDRLTRVARVAKQSGQAGYIVPSIRLLSDFYGRELEGIDDMSHLVSRANTSFYMVFRSTGVCETVGSTRYAIPEDKEWPLGKESGLPTSFWCFSKAPVPEDGWQTEDDFLFIPADMVSEKGERESIVRIESNLSTAQHFFLLIANPELARKTGCVMETSMDDFVIIISPGGEKTTLLYEGEIGES